MTSVEPVLVAALEALGQQPPAELYDASLGEIWAWADQHWQIDVLRGLIAISTGEQAMAQQENPLR